MVVVNKDILGTGDLIPRSSDANCIIVVLEQPDPKGFIQFSYFFPNPARHHGAEKVHDP